MSQDLRAFDGYTRLLFGGILVAIVLGALFGPFGLFLAAGVVVWNARRMRRARGRRELQAGPPPAL